MYICFMNSLTVENYLKALFTLANGNGEVLVNDLAIHLAIKKPTVTSMMKKLANKHLVSYESYKPIKLTEKGRKAASLIVRKHRLTEMFLVEHMKFGWEEVHEIAEQLEHIQSEKLFEKMDELLNFPKTDPHGSPIPDKLGNISALKTQKLSECKVKELLRFTGVLQSSQAFLIYLNERKFALGMEFEIVKKEDFDQSITIQINEESTFVLSDIVCQRILVERIKN